MISLNRGDMMSGLVWDFNAPRGQQLKQRDQYEAERKARESQPLSPPPALSRLPVETPAPGIGDLRAIERDMPEPPASSGPMVSKAGPIGGKFLPQSPLVADLSNTTPREAMRKFYNQGYETMSPFQKITEQFVGNLGSSALLGVLPAPPEPETTGQKVAAGVGKFIGYAAPWGAAAKVTAPIVRPLAPILGKLGPSLGRVATAGVRDALAGGLVGGAEATVQGESPAGVAKAAGTGAAVGGIGGMTLEGAGQALKRFLPKRVEPLPSEPILALPPGADFAGRPPEAEPQISGLLGPGTPPADFVAGSPGQFIPTFKSPAEMRRFVADVFPEVDREAIQRMDIRELQQMLVRASGERWMMPAYARARENAPLPPHLGESQAVLDDVSAELDRFRNVYKEAVRGIAAELEEQQRNARNLANEFFGRIKAEGGIRPYRNGFLREEYRAMPGFLRAKNRSRGMSPDEMASALGFESEGDLLAAIREHVKPLRSRVDLAREAEDIFSSMPQGEGLLQDIQSRESYLGNLRGIIDDQLALEPPPSVTQAAERLAVETRWTEPRTFAAQAEPIERVQSNVTPGRGPVVSKPVTQGFPAGIGPQLPPASPGAVSSSADPVRRSEIIQELSERLGVPTRVGRYSIKDALGIFKIQPKVIRLKTANDLPVVSHEVGHFLDHELGLQDPAFDSELMRVGAGTSRANYSPDQVRAEGVAEFTRLYLTDPATAQKTAPNYFAAFEQKMQANPDIHKVLLNARQGIQDWIAQPPEMRVKGSLSVGENRERLPGIGEVFNKAYAAGVDELRPLQVAEREIAGGAVPVEKSPFKKAWLARGWTGKADALLHYGIVDRDFNNIGPSLDEVLSPVKDRIEDFRAYAVARRALELGARGKETGIDLADIQSTLDKYHSPEFENAMRGLVAFQDGVLRQLVDSGVISPNAALTMRAMNREYVPFYRVFEEAGNAAGFGRSGYANLNNPVKKFKGSTRDIIDPLESVIRNTYAMTNLAERNEVGRTLVELAEDAARNAGPGSPSIGKWVEKVATPMHGTEFKLDEIKKQLEAAGADVSGMNLDQVAAIFRPSMFAPGKENILTVFRNGKQEFYQVHPDLYRALLALDKEQVSTVMKILSYPASLLRAGATLNPDFIARNPVRDQFSAFVNSRYGFVPVVDFTRGLFHALKKDDLYWQWQAAGGAHGNLVSLDRDYLQGTLKALLRPTRLTGNIKEAVKHPIGALRALSELTEEATRLGEFAKGVTKEGGSREGIMNAALSSRDLTIDFTRAGNSAKVYNRIAAFFNASIQGVDKMVRQWQENPVRSTVKATTAITLPSIILYAVNRNNPAYEELPQWRKDLFWNFPAGDHFVSIPKPFLEGVVFGTLPERVLAWIDKEDPHAFDEFGKTFMDAATPNVLPTALVPAWEQASNKNYAGRPIVPRGQQDLEPRAQYGPYTSETAKLIGRTFNWSPRMVDNWIKGLTGGLGRYAVDAADKGLEATGVAKPPPKPARDLSQVPILKAFTAKAYESPDSVDRFYNNLNASERGSRTAKAEGRKLPPLDQIRLKRERSTADKLSELRKQVRKVEAATNLTPEEKRAKLNELNTKMMNLARKAVGRAPIAK